MLKADISVKEFPNFLASVVVVALVEAALPVALHNVSLEITCVPPKKCKNHQAIDCL